MSISCVAGSQSTRRSRHPGAHDRFGGGDEGVRRNDDLRTGGHSGGADRQFEGVGAVADAEAVVDAEVLGHLPFELTDVGSVDEGAGRHDRADAGGHLVGDLGVLPSEIDQGDRTGGDAGRG